MTDAGYEGEIMQRAAAQKLCDVHSIQIYMRR